MNSVRDTPKGWVSPFGHPRINDCSHLPAAFRSVPRPSSPLGAKASTECPSLTPYPHHRPRTGPNHAPCNYLSQAVAPASSPASRSNSARRCAPLTHTTDHLHHVKEHAHPQQHPDPIKGSGHRHRAGFGSVATPHEAAHQTSTVTGRRLGAQPLSLTPRRERKWRRSDSNRRPPACKAGALPLSYAPYQRVSIRPHTAPGAPCSWRLALRAQLAGLRPSGSARFLVGPGRFELPTSRLSSARSNQLSYEPGSL
jgi:hypothetical protein